MEENTRLIERIFQLLELLSHCQKSMSLSEIVRESGMSKTTVYRLLTSMTDLGYLTKNQEGHYSIGYKFMELASYHINNLELQTEAKPFLTALYSELNLTVHMGTLEGSEIVYIEKLDLYPNKKNPSQVGFKTPAYCSSIGKCLMSCLSGEELDEVLYSCHFKKYTEHTITNIYEMKKHLKEVRKQGWAMDNGEHLPNRRCVGAPIFDYLGSAIASVSVSGDTTQISDERLPSIIEEVKDTARQISMAMGYVC